MLVQEQIQLVDEVRDMLKHNIQNNIMTRLIEKIYTNFGCLAKKKIKKNKEKTVPLLIKLTVRFSDYSKIIFIHS